MNPAQVFAASQDLRSTMLLSAVKYIYNGNKADLLAEATAGKQTAYRQLFEGHVGFMHNAVLTILGNRQDAKDGAQIVSFPLWRKAITITGESILSNRLCSLPSGPGLL
jgi:hypothetical protein